MEDAPKYAPPAAALVPGEPAKLPERERAPYLAAIEYGKPQLGDWNYPDMLKRLLARHDALENALSAAVSQHRERADKAEAHAAHLMEKRDEHRDYFEGRIHNLSVMVKEEKAKSNELAAQVARQRNELAEQEVEKLKLITGIKDVCGSLYWATNAWTAQDLAQDVRKVLLALLDGESDPFKENTESAVRHAELGKGEDRG